MSDIDTVVVDSLKALDPERPIREEKRTSLMRSGTSALCQKATFALQQIFLFDHLVGAGEERRWHSNAKRLGRFEIDYQFVLGRRLHR